MQPSAEHKVFSMFMVPTALLEDTALSVVTFKPSGLHWWQVAK